MKPSTFVPFVVACFILLPGCSQLKLEKVRTITLNATAEGALENMFGSPYATERYNDSSGAASTTYFYHETSPSGIGPFIWLDYTSLVVETRKGLVTAYVFACTHGDADATRFAAAGLDRITVGQSREQVIAALGPPHGMALNGTTIAGLKTFDAPGVTQQLVWVDAPQVKGTFKPDDATLNMFIVQLAADGRVSGKAHRSVTVHF